MVGIVQYHNTLVHCHGVRNSQVRLKFRIKIILASQIEFFNFKIGIKFLKFMVNIGLNEIQLTSSFTIILNVI